MSGWVTVARWDDLPDGARRSIDVAGREVTVLRLGERVVALRNRCPHANGRLGDGEVKDGAIVCPLHRWRFSLDDGSTRRDPHLRAELLPARIEDGEVRVEVPKAWASAPPDP
ncbi:MAG: Rieske (2Fe-2S) protein [Planctomycetota bacterium JB042]